MRIGPWARADLEPSNAARAGDGRAFFDRDDERSDDDRPFLDRVDFVRVGNDRVGNDRVGNDRLDYGGAENGPAFFDRIDDDRAYPYRADDRTDDRAHDERAHDERAHDERAHDERAPRANDGRMNDDRPDDRDNHEAEHALPGPPDGPGIAFGPRSGEPLPAPEDLSEDRFTSWSWTSTLFDDAHDDPHNAPVTSPVAYPAGGLDDESDDEPDDATDDAPMPAFPMAAPVGPRSAGAGPGWGSAGPGPAGAGPGWGSAGPGPTRASARKRRRLRTVPTIITAVVLVITLAVAVTSLVARRGRYVGGTGSANVTEAGSGTGGADESRQPSTGDTGGAGQPVEGPAHAVSAPVGALTEGEFQLLANATTVTLRTSLIDNDLYRAVTPDTSRFVPRAVQDGGRVQLDLVDINGGDGLSALEVVLNSRIKWRVRIIGGTAASTVDLRSADLTGLDFAGGAKRIEVWLPRPAGTVVTRMAGGASEFAVHAPPGVPVRVRIGPGAASVNIDGVTHSGIAPGTVFTPPGWDRAANREDIEAAAGASAVTVDRY